MDKKLHSVNIRDFNNPNPIWWRLAWTIPRDYVYHLAASRNTTHIRNCQNWPEKRLHSQPSYFLHRCSWLGAESFLLRYSSVRKHLEGFRRWVQDDRSSEKSGRPEGDACFYPGQRRSNRSICFQKLRLTISHAVKLQRYARLMI